MKSQGDILVTSSKGDNYRLEGVICVSADDSFIHITSGGTHRSQFDRIPRDRTIELVNVEVEDIGF